MQNPIAKDSPWLNKQKYEITTWASKLSKINVSAYFQQDARLNRLATHIIMVALIVLMMIVGGVRLSRRQLRAPQYISPQLNARNESTPHTGNPLTLSGKLENRKISVLQPAAVLQTIIPDRTVVVEEVLTYKAQSGDTLSGIAAAFGLLPETLLWSNSDLEDNPDLLNVGQDLIVLPVDGVYHQAGSEDTIEGIAAAFKVEPEAIINYHLNNIDPENPQIIAGQWLIVPGGEKPYVPKYVSVAVANAPSSALGGTGVFNWPTNGSITQDFWRGHRALDIGAWSGAPVYAADSGYVVSAQWDDSGYGRMIVIDHGNGFKTLYAHLSVIYVSVGDEVTAGQQIGEMGSTGNSTGAHLHFEVMLNGAQRNPWGFLP